MVLAVLLISVAYLYPTVSVEVARPIDLCSGFVVEERLLSMN
jgi:hypothetical protein